MRKKVLATIALLTIGWLPSSSATLIEQSELRITTEHRQATGLIVHLMSNYHYLKAPLDDQLSEQIVEGYLDALDPNRLIFLRSDVQTFVQAYRTRFDDFLRTGYLKPAFEIFKVFRERVAERTVLANQLLGEGFDYAIDEDYGFRDQDSAWPASKDEMNELWRKRVKNDLLALRLAGRTDEEALKALTKRYEGVERRAHQLNSNDVFQLFINAYTMAVEPHTAYFSPRTSENFKIRMSLSLEGIGAALQTEHEYTVVRRIIPGGPADLSKALHVDDRIVGVAQGDEAMVEVISWRLEDVVELIRGPKDTVVRLEVRNKDKGADGPSDVITLVRNKIKLEAQAAKKSVLDLADHGVAARIGVIDIPTFYLDMAAMSRGESDYRSTTRDVRRLIGELRQEGVDGVIIDLRGNGGGSLLEATELTGLFISSGPVVQVKDSTGGIKINDDPNPDIAYEGPLAVLVDRQSASASEIFAGAMQDYHRGIVVGEPTYGKGTVQNVVDLNRFVGPEVGKLGQLKVTIAQFFRVNGASTQHRGVVPDIVFPTARNNAEEGERALENALPWAQVKAAYYKPHPELEAALGMIRPKHEARVRKDPGFRYLLAEADARKTLQNLETVSLLKARREKEIDERKQQSSERLNRFRIASGLEPLDQEDESKPEMDEEDNIDILLNEAGLILSDLIEIGVGSDALRAKLSETTHLTADREAR